MAAPLKPPEGFKVEEFVPPEVFSLLGDEAIKLMNPDLLDVLGQIRKDFGPLIINNWHTRSGTFRYRGFRPLTYSGGSPRSQHRAGCAIDCHSPKIPVDELRAKVIAKARANEGVYAKIGGIEDGVNWLHFDVRPRVNGQQLVFNP